MEGLSSDHGGIDRERLREVREEFLAIIEGVEKLTGLTGKSPMTLPF